MMTLVLFWLAPAEILTRRFQATSKIGKVVFWFLFVIRTSPNSQYVKAFNNSHPSVIYSLHFRDKSILVVRLGVNIVIKEKCHLIYLVVSIY